MGVSFHRQSHLRVLLEDLRIALSKQLRHPFISHATGTEPGRVGGAEIVDPEMRNPRFLQGCTPDFFQRLLTATRVPGARKQIITWSSKGELAPKRIKRAAGFFQRFDGGIEADLVPELETLGDGFRRTEDPQGSAGKSICLHAEMES